MSMSLIVGTHYVGQTSWWLNAENHRVVAWAGRTFDSAMRPGGPQTISKHVRLPRNSKSMMRRMAGGAGVPGTPDSRWLYRPPALPLDRMPDAQPRPCGPEPGIQWTLDRNRAWDRQRHSRSVERLVIQLAAAAHAGSVDEHTSSRGAEWVRLGSRCATFKR